MRIAEALEAFFEGVSGPSYCLFESVRPLSSFDSREFSICFSVKCSVNMPRGRGEGVGDRVGQGGRVGDRVG